MSTDYFGGYVIPISFEKVNSICSEEVQAVEEIYTSIDADFLSESAMNTADFYEEVKHNVESEASLIEEASDDIGTLAADAWVALFNKFKEKTGLELAAWYYNEDDCSAHSEDIVEGVNFQIRFHDVYQKSDKALALEKQLGIELGIETFVTWG